MMEREDRKEKRWKVSEREGEGRKRDMQLHGHRKRKGDRER